MTKIPNAGEAIIPMDKLVGYLLSSKHPIGRFKATYFARLGFREEYGPELETAFRKLLAADFDSTESTEFGDKYVISGRIGGPNGRVGYIVTVWIILRGERVPRFVTAYPGDET
jgi:hypothetical protein